MRKRSPAPLYCSVDGLRPLTVGSMVAMVEESRAVQEEEQSSQVGRERRSRNDDQGQIVSPFSLSCSQTSKLRNAVCTMHRT